MVKNLFVGSLPYTVTNDTLGQLFSQVGPITSANVISDKYTGRSRGFGFVEMANEEDAKKAIETLNGHMLEGRAIIVKEALPKPTYTSGGGNQRPQRGGYRGGSGGGGGFNRGR